MNLDRKYFLLYIRIAGSIILAGNVLACIFLRPFGIFPWWNLITAILLVAAMVCYEIAQSRSRPQ